MKNRVKNISIIVLLSLSCCMLAGCGNSEKVKTLTNEIAEIDMELLEKIEELESWQDIYDEAYEIYYAPHSDTPEIQKELERTKEYMDVASKEINALERDISLLNMERDIKQKELDELQG